MTIETPSPSPPADSAPPIVELRSVRKSFATQRNGVPSLAVNDVSLSIPKQEKGEFVVLLGPSGCGKSTILHMISGMLQPDAGEVYALGKRVVEPDSQSVTVPQAYTCFPWLSVLGNVEFGLGVQGVAAAECRRVATDYLARVGLADRLDARPKELSGGMQQRVAIARTLAMRPPIVLMDEPFGALDAQTRAEMQEMLIQLWQQERNLVVFVTHDITEALLLADRVIVFTARPAAIAYDLQVPFDRPRPPELQYDGQFVKLSKLLLDLLKRGEKQP
jgi:NitT/TauT family transport system ATP-binding protein